jgi:hypothetical protein
VGDNAGASKQRAAAKWGTRVLSEAEFLAEIECRQLAQQGCQVD